MAVKLHCAYDNNKKLRFIKERLEKNLQYYCPYCKEEVFSKKGAIREHHFAHKPDSNCSATAETILHFEAKHFLANLINEQAGNDVYFLFDLGRHVEAIGLLNKELGIFDNSTISLQKIIEFFKLSKAAVEYQIPDCHYIADVIGEDRTNNKFFIIEVFVTHESDQDKLEFIRNNNIPYLEVIPEYDADGHLRFHLHSYHLPGFFKSYQTKANNVLMKHLYPLYEQYFKEESKRQQDEKEILQYKLLAIQALKKEVQQDSYYSELLRTLDLHSQTTPIQAYMTHVVRTEPLESISYRKYTGGKFLVGKTVNTTYPIKSEQNLLYTMLNQLLAQINISSLIGEKDEKNREKIVGFELEIPQPAKLEEAIRGSIIEKLQDYEKRFEKKINSNPKT